MDGLTGGTWRINSKPQQDTKLLHFFLGTGLSPAALLLQHPSGCFLGRGREGVDRNVLFPNFGILCSATKMDAISTKNKLGLSLCTPKTHSEPSTNVASEAARVGFVPSSDLPAKIDPLSLFTGLVDSSSLV